MERLNERLKRADGHGIGQVNKTVAEQETLAGILKRNVVASGLEAAQVRSALSQGQTETSAAVVCEYIVRRVEYFPKG